VNSLTVSDAATDEDDRVSAANQDDIPAFESKACVHEHIKSIGRFVVSSGMFLAAFGRRKTDAQTTCLLAGLGRMIGITSGSTGQDDMAVRAISAPMSSAFRATSGSEASAEPQMEN